MEREQEIKQILLNILEIGILNARAAAWGGYVERCEIETDHIHNLPSLVRDLKIERLFNYYNFARTDYLRRTPDSKSFERDWTRLENIVTEFQSEFVSVKPSSE